MRTETTTSQFSFDLIVPGIPAAAPELMDLRCLEFGRQWRRGDAELVSELSAQDVKDVRRAFLLASKLANPIEGVLEPRTALPLSRESFQVGLLLSLSPVRQLPSSKLGF